MVGLILCAGAFLLCYFAGRRSILAGLCAVLLVGYFYGIVRANVTSGLTYFVFDAGVVGLYATLLLRPLTAAQRDRLRPLLPWMAVLIGWPALLLLMPVQDPLVQLVGLRAHVFFLPFLVIGALLSRTEMRQLALWVAGLNVLVFGFALLQFFLGVEMFFPRSEVTEMIYRSRDVGSPDDALSGAFRIPATFGNAGLYGATMAITLPLLLGLWDQKRVLNRRWTILLALGVMATIFGVFFSATRMNILVLLVILLAAMVSGRLGAAGRAGWVVLIAGMAWVISLEERLFQRILTLNLDTFIERLSWSINESLIAYAFQFPLGNGIGGGGSNVPHFLEHLIRNRVAIENHYGTILLEQGIPGLILWFFFIAWILLRRVSLPGDPWRFGRRLLWLAVAAYFAQGLIGIGLLSALPFSVILLIAAGWLVADPHAAAEEEAVPPEAATDAAAGPPAPLPRVAW